MVTCQGQETKQFKKMLVIKNKARVKTPTKFWFKGWLKEFALKIFQSGQQWLNRLIICTSLKKLKWKNKWYSLWLRVKVNVKLNKVIMNYLTWARLPRWKNLNLIKSLVHRRNFPADLRCRNHWHKAQHLKLSHQPGSICERAYECVILFRQSVWMRSGWTFRIQSRRN